jgi:hypothetical protein
MAKATCPVTRAEFLEKATPITVVINGVVMEAAAREFSTGSLGWYSSGTITVSVGGTPVDVQIGLNMTVAGSKDLPKKRK